MTKRTLLEIKDVDIAYGKVEAVRKVNLRIREGEIVSVIGPNGAGKTTLLSAIMGQLPSTGTIHYDGENLENYQSVAYRVGKGLCLVPESRELFSQMTIEDNLQLGAFSRYRQGARDYKSAREEVYDLFPRLRERAKQQAGTLSGGERQMLAMGRALMAKPKLLMLDEPSLGLAPLIIQEIFQIIGDLRAKGVSILLVEQNARAALRASDYGYVIETGDVVLEGPAAELAENPKVIESYLGRKSGAVTA